jgi:hypothetical protein
MRIAEVLVPAPVGGTSQVKQLTGSYPHVRVRDDGRAMVSQAGSVLLVETVRKTGLDQTVSAALAPWRRPRAGFVTCQASNDASAEHVRCMPLSNTIRRMPDLNITADRTFAPNSGRGDCKTFGVTPDHGRCIDD